MSLWTLDQAISLVRQMEAAFVPVGWHCALAGGVLHRGSSEHDLDVIAYPHCKPDADLTTLTTALVSIKMRPWCSREEMIAYWRSKGGRDTKHVEVWVAPGGGRVDLLVLA